MSTASAARVITVSKDETGDFSTVQGAVDAVPLSNTCRTIIRIAPGVYRQPVYIPKTKNFITFAGLRPEITVLTWHNTANSIDHHQVRSVLMFDVPLNAAFAVNCRLHVDPMNVQKRGFKCKVGAWVLCCAFVLVTEHLTAA